jgi:hypothetical protein
MKPIGSELNQELDHPASAAYAVAFLGGRSDLKSVDAAACSAPRGRRDVDRQRPTRLRAGLVGVLFLATIASVSCADDGVVVSADGSRDVDGSKARPADPSSTDPERSSVVVEPVPAMTPSVPLSEPAEPASLPAADVTAGMISLIPLTVTDPMLSGIDAFSVLVPQGWQANGEVQWLPFWSRQAFIQTRVVDPVTGLTIDWLPIQDFMYFTSPAGFEGVPIGGNYQGKEYRPPVTDPVQFVREFWMAGDLSHLQSATIVFVEDQPAIADEFIRGFGAPANAGAWRIRYEYVSGGVMWEQDVSFALLWSGTDPVSWYVNFASTVGAPKGELDRQAGLVSTVLASRTTTVEWEADYRVVQQLFYQGIRQQMVDTQRLVELLAQYRAESQALQQQVFDERMASIDRRNEIFRETLGGVEGYVDPVNQVVVQLPLGWDTYWVNEAGEYLAVNDPTFDPNTLNDGTWTQLQPRT